MIKCFFKDHKWTEVSAKRTNYIYDHRLFLTSNKPEPKENVVYIEKPLSLHTIDGVIKKEFKCDYCDKTKEEEVVVRENPPVRISEWLEIFAEGRVVLPKNTRLHTIK